MANFYQFRLQAGRDFQAPVRGKLILVDDTGGADGVDITPMLNNAQGRTMPARKKAFKCWTDYDALILRAAVDCTVSMFLSDQDVSLGFADGALVNVVGEVTVGNDPAARVPVEIGGSVVNVTADNVGINNGDANPVPVRQKAGDTYAVRQVLATAIVDAAAVAVGVARVKVSGDPALKAVRIRNDHATARVGLGGAGVTLDNAAIIIGPGDVWNETDAPGADWYAISDTDATTVKVQGVK